MVNKWRGELTKGRDVHAMHVHSQCGARGVRDAVFRVFVTSVFPWSYALYSRSVDSCVAVLPGIIHRPPLGVLISLLVTIRYRTILSFGHEISALIKLYFSTQTSSMEHHFSLKVKNEQWKNYCPFPIFHFHMKMENENGHRFFIFTARCCAERGIAYGKLSVRP